LGDQLLATSNAPADERRSYKAFDHVTMQLGTGQQAWADYILAQCVNPKPLTVLGTILPKGSQVKPIVCAEYGDRWSIVTTGVATKTVEVIGATITLAPDGVLEVDAVTEDV
jgi:hypothetical protein